MVELLTILKATLSSGALLAMLTYVLITLTNQRMDTKETKKDITELKVAVATIATELKSLSSYVHGQNHAKVEKGSIKKMQTETKKRKKLA